MTRLSATLAPFVFAMTLAACNKAPAEEPAPKTEPTEKKVDKAKDDKPAEDPAPIAKTDDSAAADDPDQAPDEPVDETAEALPVPSDYAEAAQATIKPQDDYKARLDQLEADIGKE